MQTKVRMYIAVTPSTGDKFHSITWKFKNSCQILRTGSISTSKRSIMTTSMMLVNVNNIGTKMKFKITLIECIFVFFIFQNKNGL